MLDDEQCWRAATSRDARFDGWFVGAVTTTGIYCRPSCPVVSPRRQHVRWYPTPAAAQSAGFRACKRCRPDSAPGSPEWDHQAHVAGRAVRLVADGLVDREGVAGLARRLGYSRRHLHRVLVAELGAGPSALARAQRAQTARTLAEGTTLPMTEVAFAAGFGSIRQFNATVQDVYGMPPGELRRRSRVGLAAGGTVVVRLACRRPLDWDGLLAGLARVAVPAVAEVADGRYRRSLALPHGDGVVTAHRGADAAGYAWVVCHVHLADLRDLSAAVARCRRLLDLDSDPAAVDAHLGADPVLGPLVRRRPGLRLPGCPDPQEAAIWAVLSRGATPMTARQRAGQLTARWGRPLATPSGGVSRVFPDAERLAGVPPENLDVPRSRQLPLNALVVAIAEGRVSLHAGTSRDEARAALGAVPGLGEDVPDAVAQALGDPDILDPTSSGLLSALAALGLPATPAAAHRRASAWSPWRSYAAEHLRADTHDRTLATAI